MRISDWSSDVCSSDLLPNDPARWAPEGFEAAPRPAIATFYLTPTTYLRRDRWNAPLDDRDSDERARLFTQTQASVFNGVTAVWAPRYRQATFGAFLTDQQDAEAALDFAYQDIAAAFDAFIAARSEEHTSELQSLLRTSYAVFF